MTEWDLGPDRPTDPDWATSLTTGVTLSQVSSQGESCCCCWSTLLSAQSRGQYMYIKHLRYSMHFRSYSGSGHRVRHSFRNNFQVISYQVFIWLTYCYGRLENFFSPGSIDYIMITWTKKMFQEENREVFVWSRMHFLDLKYLTEKDLFGKSNVL